MKITMYELLGMIKDGKAPKKIEYEGYLLSWDNVDKDYYCEEYGNLFEYLFCEFQTTELLNFTVEILKEKKIPEKIEYYDDSIAWVIDDVGQLSDVDKVIIDKLNDVIDYLKSEEE